MDAAKLAETLTSHSLLTECEPEELSAIVARAQVRSFKPGQAVMTQGDRSEEHTSELQSH